MDSLSRRLATVGMVAWTPVAAERRRTYVSMVRSTNVTTDRVVQSRGVHVTMHVFNRRRSRRTESSPSSQLSKRPLPKLPHLPHMLFNIRLQMPRSRLPVVFRVADAAGKEDKLFRIGGGKHKIFGFSRTMRSPSTNMRMKI